MKKIFSILAMTFFMIGFYACQNKVESGPSFIFKEAPSKKAVAKVNGKVIQEDELLELLDDLNYRLTRVKIFNSSLEFEIFQFLNRFH